MRPIIHPGEMLREEFLKPLGLSVEKLARDLWLPIERLRALLDGKASVCADLALRLSRYLGTSEHFWLDVQMRYDLERARRASGFVMARIAPLRNAA